MLLAAKTGRLNRALPYLFCAFREFGVHLSKNPEAVSPPDFRHRHLIYGRLREWLLSIMEKIVSIASFMCVMP